MTGKKIFNGRALYVDQNTIWVAKGLSFWGIDKNGKRMTRKYHINSKGDKLIGYLRLSRQLLRVGIHHLLPLKDGNFLISIKRKIIIMDKEGNILNIFSSYQGNKPAHRGICVTPEGTIFLGEYTINIKNENKTRLYRSTDNGRSFHEILILKKNEVRHIHFVQWDKYENCIWLGTGDKDYECKLMKSTDNGDTWQLVGEGSQLWRAIGISCTQDALYWGTDAGSVSDPNYIIKMDRKTRQIEKVQPLQGPCHGNAVMEDGYIYVATGIEGGENEEDHYAHVWKGNEKGKFLEVCKLKKDIFPNIVQYGVVRFPMGLDTSKELIYTTYALVHAPENVFIIEKEG